MQDKFLTQLQTWAQAGDGDCAYKLATIYRSEGDLKSYAEWLEKSAATKNFDAMKEFAEYLYEKGEHEKKPSRFIRIWLKLSTTKKQWTR